MERSEVTRISAEEAHRKLQSGQAMLVCGYEADEKFSAMQLAGAESYNTFLGRLPKIAKEQEIIFYCA